MIHSRLKIWNSKATYCWVAFLNVILATASMAYTFSYSGRLVDRDGKPLPGPVALKISFHHAEVSTVPVLDVTTGIDNVTLKDGVFQIVLTLEGADFQRVFPSVNQDVYIEVTDLTNAPSAPYGRQRLTMLPYAGKVPVDSSQFSWTSDGKLQLVGGGTSDATTAATFSNKTIDAGSNTITNISNASISATAAIADSKLATISTAGKVSGAAITSGTIAGTTAVSTSGSIATTGKVGVGAAAGTSQMEVKGGGATSATSSLNVMNSAGSSKLFVRDDGNVGIGTTSPTYKLNVVGEGTGTSQGIVNADTYSSTAATDRSIMLLQRARGSLATPSDVVNGDSVGSFQANSRSGASFLNSAGIDFAIDGTFTSGLRPPGRVTFSTATADAASSTERMRINSAGNVGIGTKAPSNTLSVSPVQYSTGTASQSTTTVTGSGTTWTSAMIGSQFVFADGTSAGTITAFGSATSLTVSVSQTVASQAYTIHYTGLNVTSTGNVGVGTTNSSNTMTLAKGGALGPRFHLYNSDSNPAEGGRIIFGEYLAEERYWLKYDGLNNSLTFHSSDAANVMSMSQYGNMGIGISSPNEKLEVSGGSRIGKAPTTLLTVSGAHTSAVTTITASAATSGYPLTGTLLIGTEAITYTGITGSTFTGCTRGALGTTATAFVGGETINNYLETIVASATTPKMVVTGSGNVGIGTTSPNSSLLHLYQGASSANPYTAGGNPELLLESSGMTDLHLLSPDNGQSRIWFGSPATSIGGQIRYAPNATAANASLQLWSGGNTAMSLLGSGNVGIGTTSPQAKLHVYGGALCVSGDAGSHDCSGAANTAGTIFAMTTAVAGADYAEYFAAEDSLVPGEIVGLNPQSGLVRRYHVGDKLVGVASTKPGVIGNSKIKDQNSVLVGLMGQVPFNRQDTHIEGNIVKTQDGIQVGYLLASGDLYLQMSSVDKKLNDLKLEKDKEISQLKSAICELKPESAICTP